MNFSFGNGALLWGTLLFSVPLIIHLLNRRRYVVVKWAAQQFLLQAYQQTRRRLTLESLLLLLLRCLLVLLLAFALARPFVPSSSVLSFLSPSQKSVVIVVDTSYSMGRTNRSGESMIERAKAQAKRILEGLSEERGDEVTVVALSNPPRTIHSTSTAIERVVDTVDRLTPDATGADLVRTLDFLNENVLGGTHKDVYFLTDLQRATFAPGVAGASGAALTSDDDESAATTASAWRAAAINDARFVVVDVGVPDPPVNLAVEELVSRPRNVVAGEVVRFSATIRNHTDHEIKSVAATFLFDDETERGKPVVFSVPAGGVTTVECSTKFRDEGGGRESHTAKFVIDDDDLLADNERTLAFTVDEAVRVLVVDGDMARGQGSRETDMLLDMLNPSDDPETGGSVFRLKVVDDRKFNLRAEDLTAYELIVLANVAQIDEKTARELDDAVRAGRGLLVFLGELVDPRSYNERLYDVDGTGLMPARLLDVRGDLGESSDASFFPVVDDFFHPMLRLFDDPVLKPNLLEVPVRRFYRTEIGPKDRATKVIMALDDDPADPGALVLEKPAGRGRVILFTTTADDFWAGFARDNNVLTYLPLIQETAAYLTLSDHSLFNLRVGEPLRKTTRSIPSEINVTRPDNTRVAVTDTPREMEYGEFVLPAFVDTRIPGTYALELEYPLSGAGSDAGRREVDYFAVNVDVRESDSARVEAAAFPTLYPGVEIEVATEIDTAPLATRAAREGELWRALLWALVGLLTAEMLLAWWFGRGYRGVAP